MNTPPPSYGKSVLAQHREGMCVCVSCVSWHTTAFSSLIRRSHPVDPDFVVMISSLGEMDVPWSQATTNSRDKLLVWQNPKGKTDETKCKKQKIKSVKSEKQSQDTCIPLQTGREVDARKPNWQCLMYAENRRVSTPKNLQDVQGGSPCRGVEGTSIVVVVVVQQRRGNDWMVPRKTRFRFKSRRGVQGS